MSVLKLFMICSPSIIMSFLFGTINPYPYSLNMGLSLSYCGLSENTTAIVISGKNSLLYDIGCVKF